MSRNLNQEEKERVKDRFGEHIFFRLVNQSCKKYERELKVFRLSPEDIFVEVLNVLDDMKARPENNADLCDTIWDDLYCAFRERGEDIPETELTKAVAVVISLVMYCLVLLNMTRYNGVVGRLNLLLTEQYKGYGDIALSFDTFASKIGKDALYKWVYDYMQCNDYLSEEVEDCIDMEEAMLIYENSKVYLNPKRGSKIDFIRVVNVLYELGFFTDAQGNSICKKEVFTTLGRFVNVNLEDYDKDLSRALNDSTALDKHLKIFERMGEKMEEIFNSK